MNKSLIFAVLSFLILPGLTLAQVPTILKLPPAQLSVVAEGMGNAVQADGTLFNASSFNPALLSQAPHMVEAFGLGLNISNDIFGVVDYVQNLKFQEDQVYQQLSYGIANGNSVSINAGLSSVDDLVNHLTDKALQAGAGVNVAVKIDKHFGIQVYNSTHAFSQLWRGNLTNALLAVPLDSNSANSAAVSNAVTVMAVDIENGIEQVLSASQRATLSSDITAYKNGSESLDTFVSQVTSTFSTVDGNSLRQSILNSLVNDIATLTALLYSDTVAMATFDLDPFEKEIPGLTVGASLKLVNRHFTYDSFSFNNSSGSGNAFADTFTKQSTTRWGFDFGALYALPNVPLDFGLSVLDLFHSSGTVTGPTGSLTNNFMTDPAPTVVSLGASFHPAPGLRVNGEVDDLFSSTSLYDGNNSASKIKLGADYSLAGFFNVRAGFGDQNFSFGAGLMAGFFGLNYSYGVDDLSQAYNHYAQLSFVF